MRTFRRLLAFAVFVAALVLGWRFAGANLDPVRIQYLVGTTGEIPLWGALLASAGAGAALAGLVGLYQAARLSLTARRWRKVARGLEAELHQLRNLPLAAAGDAPPARGSAGAPAPSGPEPSTRGR
jgi:uncharacterized integral membrane protein